MYHNSLRNTPLISHLAVSQQVAELGFYGYDAVVLGRNIIEVSDTLFCDDLMHFFTLIKAIYFLHYHGKKQNNIHYDSFSLGA